MEIFVQVVRVDLPRKFASLIARARTRYRVLVFAVDGDEMFEVRFPVDPPENEWCLTFIPLRGLGVDSELKSMVGRMVPWAEVPLFIRHELTDGDGENLAEDHTLVRLW